MNIKKMFTALSAMVVACAMLLPNASVFAATYSQELQDAYNWAYSKGVTTMSPIDNANMYGAITRSEMAKMLSVYATEVLGMTPDTSAACTFSDIDSVKGDLHDYIIESCQLGIMGQGITAFRPYDTISRAEFGTALSRVLWGSQYEGGTPYYAKHLDALKAAGIMTQIANAESTKEIRGYVMLMLMRSEGSTPSICEDTDVKVICAVEAAAEEYKDCPVACRAEANEEPAEDVVVKSGDLAVKSSAANDGRRVLVSPDGAVSDLDTLTFKTSEEVTLSKVVLEKYGYSTGAIVAGVWLEDEDGNVITNKATLNKGKATLTLKKDYKVIDGTLNATIVLETLADDEVIVSALGGTIGFKVSDVVSTAKNVDLGDYKAYTYDIVMYEGSVVEISARGGEKDYNFEAGKLYEVSKFKVRAPKDSGILVKGFTLTDLAEGEVDVDKYLDEVVVKVAGEEVKATTSINKNDQLVVSLKNAANIEAGKSVEFLVELSLTEDFNTYGTYLVYYIAENSDFSATDVKTESRVQPQFNNYDPLECYFAGGKVRLTNTKLGALEYAVNSNDVKIAEGSLTIPQSIKGTLTLTLSGEEAAAKEAITNVRLLVGDDEFDGTWSGNAEGYEFKNIEIEEGGKVRILVDIEEVQGAEGNVVEFELNGWEGFKYTDGKGYNNEVDVSGSISVSKLTLKAAKGSLTNSLKEKDDREFKNKEDNTYVVLDGTYTAKKVDVYLDSFYVTGGTATGFDALGNSKITFYLYLDGSKTPTAESNFDADELKAADTFPSLLVKANESITVRLEAEVDAKVTDADQLPVNLKQFTLGLAGLDENDNDVDFATRRTVNVSIVAAGTVDIEPGVNAKSVLKKAAATVAQLTAKPNGAEEVDIDTVEFKMLATPVAGGEDLSREDVRLYVGNTDVELTNPGSTPWTFSVEVTEKAKKEGTPIKVEIVEPFAGTVELSGFSINGGTPSTKVFKQQFVDTLVSFSALEDAGAASYVYKFDVDGNKAVSEFTVYTSTGNCLADGWDNDTTDGIYATTPVALQKGDTVSIKRVDAVQEICGVSYKLEGIDDPVEIDKVTYPDYFKIGGKTIDIPKA